MNTTPSDVCGIGDVELEVRRSTGSSARKNGRSTMVLVLEGVLHVPTALCNIFGRPDLDQYSLHLRSDEHCDGKITCSKTGSTVSLLGGGGLWRLWLKGQSRGQTSLQKPNTAYLINATWSKVEATKWKIFKSTAPILDYPSSESGAMRSKSHSQTPGDQPYTKAEKRWLKENFRGEYYFLQTYGLSIYNEEDREEGRNIARTMIRYDDEDGSSRGDHEIDEDGDYDREQPDAKKLKFLQDLERDPFSHTADHWFNEAELEWVEQGYQNSGAFLRSFGLSPFDDEDCAKGMSIVRAFIFDSSGESDGDSDVWHCACNCPYVVADAQP